MVQHVSCSFSKTNFSICSESIQGIFSQVEIFHLDLTPSLIAAFEIFYPSLYFLFSLQCDGFVVLFHDDGSCDDRISSKKICISLTFSKA